MPAATVHALIMIYCQDSNNIREGRALGYARGQSVPEYLFGMRTKCTKIVGAELLARRAESR